MKNNTLLIAAVFAAGLLTACGGGGGGLPNCEDGSIEAVVDGVPITGACQRTTTAQMDVGTPILPAQTDPRGFDSVLPNANATRFVYTDGGTEQHEITGGGDAADYFVYPNRTAPIIVDFNHTDFKMTMTVQNAHAGGAFYRSGRTDRGHPENYDRFFRWRGTIQSGIVFYNFQRDGWAEIPRNDICTDGRLSFIRRQTDEKTRQHITALCGGGSVGQAVKFTPRRAEIAAAAIKDIGSKGMAFHHIPARLFVRWDGKKNRQVGISYDFGGFAARADFAKLPAKEDGKVMVDDYRLGAVKTIGDVVVFAGADNYRNGIAAAYLSRGNTTHRLAVVARGGVFALYELSVKL